MTRQSDQKGWVSKAIRTKRGVAYKIRWRIRGAEGKWKHKSETLYGLSGKMEARRELRKRLDDSSPGTPLSEITLREFMDDQWRPYLDRKRMKPSTIEGYECILNKHTLPVLGDYRLQQISPVHVEQFVQSIESGMFPRTLRNVLMVLSGMFSLAVDKDLIQRSPIRASHKPDVPDFEKEVWTAEQVKTIIDNVPKNYRALFVTVAFSGVRLGELLALQWRHVDFEHRTLQIDQSLWHGQIVPPKTKESKRTIPFGDALAANLNGHLKNSAFIGQQDFVLCKADGSTLNPDVLRKNVLYPTLDRAGIPRSSRASGFHAFRHSAASLVNKHTGNLKLAQRLLGHADIATTADTYTHTWTEDERGAAMAIEKAVLGESVPNVPQN